MSGTTNRRAFLSSVATGALSLALGRAARAQPPAARKPNVLLFLTDDQGTLDVNCFGSKDLHTPNMDDLARRGVRFTQAYAHTVCCPARALLLTGRHPQRCNVNSWMQGNAKGSKGLNMFRSEVTLAETLKKAGYRTALFGKWHLGSHFDHGPTEQGFDEFFGLRDGFIDNYNHHFLHGNGYHDLYRGKKEVFRKGQYFPDLVVAEATRFLDANRDKPFFLYVAFNVPHYPEQADETFDERYKHLPMPRRSYARIVSTTDDRMGQILKKLDALGLRDNTIVAFLSDNGHSAEDYRIRGKSHASGLPEGHNYGANGGGGNTGKWRGHKGTFFEGGIRVPAILSFPGRIPAGQVRAQAIIAADFYPTLCELCGVPLPEVTLDGRSLTAVLRSADAPSPHKVLHWQWQRTWAVREGDWKLISRGRGARGLHLGSLADPEPEKKNYAAEKPELVDRLTRLHEAWAKDVFPEGSSPPAPKRGPAKRAGRPGTLRVTFEKPPSALSFTDHGTAEAAGREGGKARRFSGEDAWLDLPPDRSPCPAGLPIAVDAWVCAAKGDGVIVAQGGQTEGYSLYLAGGKPLFAVRSGGRAGSAASTTALPKGWVRVAGRLAANGELTVLIDGRLAGKGRAPGLLAGHPGDGLQIGADLISPVGHYRPGNCFAGLIGEVTVKTGK